MLNHVRYTLFAVVAGFLLLLVPMNVHAQRASSAITTVHINVEYQAGISEADARRVSDYLQNDYNYLSDKLGLDFKKRLEVRIYDSVGKFLSATRVNKPWRGAVYARGVLSLQPVQALVQRGIFEQSLSYELALGLLDQTAGKGCPRWLRESFAVYHSGEMGNLSVPVGARLSSFSDLDQDIQQYPNPPQRDDVHYVLGQTMKFFVEKFGEAKAFSVYKAFNSVTPVEDIFKKIFKQEFRTTERTWANFIAAETDIFKKRPEKVDPDK